MVMLKKEIYNNGSSNLIVEFDGGELVSLKQELFDIDQITISLYVDELEEIWNFVSSKLNNK